MIFTVLGSGTSVPDPERGPAGFLVQVGGRAWLVDGGTGTVQRCARAGVDPRQLDGGFYTHRHPDHCADLLPLLFSMRIGPPRRARDYPIWGGEGFAAYVDQLRGVYGRWVEPGGQVLVHEVPLDRASTIALGDLTVRTAPANHSAGALHLRFEAAGVAVVLSGDTGPSGALVELARGADLLVCECGGADDDRIEGHLWPSAIAELVKEARPAEVWLTHLYPQVDPRQAVEIVGRSGASVRHAADLERWEA